MSKKIIVTLECGKDKTFSCYNETDIGDYVVIDGDGATAEEAKADFLRAIDECVAAHPDDQRLKGLEFTYRYDLKSFFNYFSFFNVNEVARRAGISPTVMRQYMCGAKKASDKTYDKISACMSKITSELQAAKF